MLEAEHLLDEASKHTGQGSEELIARARAIAEDVQQANPDEPKTQFVLARAFYIEGKDKDAYALLVDYVRTPAGDADGSAYALMGNILFRGQFLELAQQKLVEALKRDPGNAKILVDLADVCLAKKDWSGAIEFAQKALGTGTSSLDETQASRAEGIIEKARQKDAGSGGPGEKREHDRSPDS